MEFGLRINKIPLEAVSLMPDTPPVEDLIRYDILAQEALRSVVKKVIQEEQVAQMIHRHRRQVKL